jgi:lipopolysaccharide/colanic/teichoic acid biosynthesis glycosyltransferase
VRPGITGLWQVSGRNHTTYRRRVACDVAYAKTKSISCDLIIIARTVPTVLFGRGAY